MYVRGIRLFRYSRSLMDVLLSAFAFQSSLVYSGPVWMPYPRDCPMVPLLIFSIACVLRPTRERRLDPPYSAGELCLIIP